MLDSINAYLPCPCIVNGRSLTFDGTLRGLVRVAVENGARHGDRIEASFGAGFRKYTLYAAPHDDRAYGYWIN